MPEWVQPIGMVIFFALAGGVIAAPIMLAVMWFTIEPHEVRAAQIKRLWARIICR